MSASYRLYILDSRDRTILDAIEVGHCIDDTAAMMKAAPFLQQRPAELWDRARRVYQYEPSAFQQ